MANRSTETPTVAPPGGLASALERNISAIAERRKVDQARSGLGERLAEHISRFAGSMAFVALHLLLVAGWVLVNVGMVPGVKAFDASFVILATASSVEAIFLSTFILISQNRASAAADRRADLDLQIGLVAEHEVTHLITLTQRIAEHLGIDEASNPELDELGRNVAPEAVLERIARTQD